MTLLACDARGSDAGWFQPIAVGGVGDPYTIYLAAACVLWLFMCAVPPSMLAMHSTTAVTLVGLLASATALSAGLKITNWGAVNEVWEAPTVSKPLGSITRAVALSRAREWVDAKIPYCQCAGGPASECCGNCPYCSDCECTTSCNGVLRNFLRVYCGFAWDLLVHYQFSLL